MGFASNLAGSLPSISSFSNLGSMMGRPTRSACQLRSTLEQMGRVVIRRTTKFGDPSLVLSAGEEVEEQVVREFVEEEVSSA